MIQQVRRHAAVVGKVLSEAEEVVRVPRNVFRKTPFVAEPSIPPNVAVGIGCIARTGIGIDVPIELSASRVAAIASLEQAQPDNETSQRAWRFARRADPI